MVARRAHNPKVVGSNPASATTKSLAFARLFCCLGLFSKYFCVICLTFNPARISVLQHFLQQALWIVYLIKNYYLSDKLKFSKLLCMLL